MRYKFPNDPNECADFVETAKKYVIPGYAPKKPFLSRNREVVSAGSCFAGNIADALEGIGVPATYLRYTEAINTPPATLAIIKKALAGLDEFKAAREKLAQTQVFICTLGVALSPHRGTEPIVEAVAKERDIIWRMISPDSAAQTTLSIIELLKAVNPEITIVLTLSPLPLNSSFGHPSVFGQDCVSKSTLRVALEWITQQNIPNVYYWPSFEMIRWMSGHMGQMFGMDGADNRHVTPYIIDLITKLFIDTYFLDVEPVRP